MSSLLKSTLVSLDGCLTSELTLRLPATRRDTSPPPTAFMRLFLEDNTILAADSGSSSSEKAGSFPVGSSTTESAFRCNLTSSPLVNLRKCHPPRPTDFLMHPRLPTMSGLVRLFPMTTTLVCGESTTLLSASSALFPCRLCASSSDSPSPEDLSWLPSPSSSAPSSSSSSSFPPSSLACGGLTGRLTSVCSQPVNPVLAWLSSCAGPEVDAVGAVLSPFAFAALPAACGDASCPSCGTDDGTLPSLEVG
mmetsp:Transcript_3266/g.8204  ORF Transcript_3266/g.8204 Transcript_3266/m.8204 type:complete len:250 (-) Transcript_3266:230-979(-)